jgi:hypothetical protein
MEVGALDQWIITVIDDDTGGLEDVANRWCFLVGVNVQTLIRHACPPKLGWFENALRSSADCRRL